MTSSPHQRTLQEAIVHHRAGRLEQAGKLYRRVLVALPRSFDANHLLGVVALQQGRAVEATALLTKASELNPRSAVCAMRLGLALMAEGKAREAEPHLRRAVEMDASFVEGWDNLAYCLKAQDRLAEAIPCHERALQLNPRHAVGWFNYGLTLSLRGRIAEALRCHERALAAKPDYAKAHFGRAQALQQAHRVTEAIAAYDRYLELEPGNLDAHGYRLFALNYDENLTREQVFAAHAAYGRVLGTHPEPDFPQTPEPARRLRLAVLSPDLRSHSCAYFLEPLLRNLDPQQFEILLYHDHFREDAVSERLKGLAHFWRNFVGQPNTAVEEIIRSDQPDILVDLAGHTGMASRMSLYARRVAPVQINYLGYPNTTGVPGMAFRFTDAWADPVGEADALATEKLVRFAPTAWAYQPLAHAPAVALPPATTGNPLVTFGCFNAPAKITDRTLRTWSRLLEAVPGSRLLLKGRGLGEEEMRMQLLARIAAAGIAPDRLGLLERTARTEQHLEVYNQVDIALDTFPYQGTTTTCEALWMGRPVVCLAGDRHAARVGVSLLHAVGHPEWVAETPEDYVRIAAELASDRARLVEINRSLREQMAGSVLCDHAGQAARFAAALRQCWTAWCEEKAALFA